MVVAAFGAFVWLGGGSLLNWFGRLPGDIRIERPGFRLYTPIVSMLLVSERAVVAVAPAELDAYFFFNGIR